jgi:hypothetical protein
MTLHLPLDEAQIACADLLKEALAEALEGRVTSIGIIACMKDGYAAVMAGHQASALNLGCDELKRRILDAISSGNVRPVAAKPKIELGVWENGRPK